MSSNPLVLFLVALIVGIKSDEIEFHLTTYDNGKICSSWIDTHDEFFAYSEVYNQECISEAELERKNGQARLCCETTPLPIPSTDFPRECGKQKHLPLLQRIVGGQDATIYSWPWQVLLLSSDLQCGGVLIDQQHVLTAAHCITYPIDPTDYVITVGLHKRESIVNKGEEIVAENIWVHELYNSSTLENDISVIRLSKPVQISDTVNVICLPGAHVGTAVNKTVWVSGWGKTYYNGYTSSVLRQTWLYTMGDMCNTYVTKVFDEDKQLCAGRYTTYSATCQGDSGGPLMYESNGQWFLNGIVSYGQACGSRGTPSVYVKPMVNQQQICSTSSDAIKNNQRSIEIYQLPVMNRVDYRSQMKLINQCTSSYPPGITTLPSTNSTKKKPVVKNMKTWKKHMKPWSICLCLILTLFLFLCMVLGIFALISLRKITAASITAAPGNLHFIRIQKFTHYLLLGWSTTNSLTIARTQHTASHLLNGKVLVAGGFNGTSLSSAVLYDPSTGLWTTTSDMNYARRYHIASVLASGKVLVAGGYNGLSLNAAELYDPLTGSWAITENMTYPRYAHAASVLTDGKVLVVGGINGVMLGTAEIYDPSTGMWTTAGNMSYPRYGHVATVLTNGKVLVTGGNNNGAVLNNVELYDSSLGLWTIAANMSSARYYHSASILSNGKIIVIGGINNGGTLNSTELYDPSTNVWTATGSVNYYRAYHTATLLTDGRVLIAGGSNNIGYLNSAEIYDPSTGLCTVTANMSFTRREHTASKLTNGKVLVTGGISSTILNSSELYHP
ncbi:unnamed protein product [Adineta ricciae]|uniref:Peptidase S1 domain-containing protein n=1 Tax=Adineta ricciae TaxID=249248 RepID=A0A815Z497_ADIRI|nr:unnamed protein product [Adineta ricciae]